MTKAISVVGLYEEKEETIEVKKGEKNTAAFETTFIRLSNRRARGTSSETRLNKHYSCLLVLTTDIWDALARIHES